MKKLFFCARDSRDYLKEIMDVSKFEKVYGFKPTLPEFNDAPVIQEFLFDLMKIYPRQVIDAINQLILDKNLIG